MSLLTNVQDHKKQTKSDYFVRVAHDQVEGGSDQTEVNP